MLVASRSFQTQRRKLRKLLFLQRVVYLLLLLWFCGSIMVTIARNRLLRTMRTPGSSPAILSQSARRGSFPALLNYRQYLQEQRGHAFAVGGGSGAFVDAMRLPTIPAFRSHLLRNHADGGFMKVSMLSLEPLSSFRRSPPTRLFSVYTNNENENENQDSNETTLDDTNHFHMASTQNVLSEPANSVRDKVNCLLRMGGNLERPSHCQQIIIPIVAAVSGGCDSVALFHALMEWNEQLRRNQQLGQEACQGSNDSKLMLQLDITVVHFHHRQRPIEADEDCRLVRELVESHNKDNNNKTRNVSFRLEDWKDRINNPEDASIIDNAGSSFSQDKARVWRRNRLRECAKQRLWSLRQHGIGGQNDANGGSEGIATASVDTDDENNNIPFGIVLTAHHDDDSYETVLIKLLRGVHLLNLHDRATIASIAPMKDNYENETNGRATRINATTRAQGEAQGRKAKEDEKIPDIYLVRPFVTDSRTIPNTIMSGHTKDDLVQYLVDRNIPWREDASNHDPNSKYLRNRVRNELIPLLKDLTDDSFRTKRIPALLEQSMELCEDLEPRVDKYLNTAVVEKNGSFFTILPLNNSCGNEFQDEIENSRLVRSQALYQWMSTCIAQGENGVPATSVSSLSRNSISYERLQRVVQQLDQYPDRRTWKLELGSGWIVQRVGDILRMAFEGDDKQSGSKGNDKDDTSTIKTTSCRDWGWARVSIEESCRDGWRKEGINSLQIQVPSMVLESSSEKAMSLEFFSTTLREAEGIDKANTLSLRFFPPWKNSSVKLRAFLRGQKVPAHLRDDTQLLFLMEKTSCDRKRLVALCIRDAWIVDKEFDIDEGKNGHESVSKSILTLERRKEK